MKCPEQCLFNEGHLWCRREDESTVTIGVSDHAQSCLGEIAYIELPEPGSQISQNTSLGVIESIKVVNELLAPVSGTVIEINENLSDDPTVVNQDPYGEGWMLRVRIESADDLAELMNASRYAAFINK